MRDTNTTKEPTVKESVTSGKLGKKGNFLENKESNIWENEMILHPLHNLSH